MSKELETVEIALGIRRVIDLLLRHHFAVERSYAHGMLSDVQIIMTLDPTALVHEALRLHRVVTSLGIVVTSSDGVRIEASYDPADDSAVLMLFGLTDAMLPEKT